MLFRSTSVARTWDTWVYHYAGTYHLYYCTSETGPGDGFGVALRKTASPGLTMDAYWDPPTRWSGIWAPAPYGSP